MYIVIIEHLQVFDFNIMFLAWHAQEFYIRKVDVFDRNDIFCKNCDFQEIKTSCLQIYMELNCRFGFPVMPTVRFLYTMVCIIIFIYFKLTFPVFSFLEHTVFQPMASTCAIYLV